MRCPRCDFENPDGLTFCGDCGARLTPACASCGFENPAGFKFCGSCGASLADPEPAPGAASAAPTPPPPTGRAPRDYTPKHLADRILTSRSALEGERKRVTVLFADIQGSMAAAEQLDPEEWHRIMDRFFAIMTEGVHRFEGTVNQYTGDGIMALFGAPIAHEDHAQRACFAALHLQDALRRFANELRVERGVPLAVRIGLNSGDVVVGRIGDDLRMDYTAQGHTVGLASRMQQIAEPGRTYLAGATAALARGYFALEDVGRSHIKGVSEPVEVFALTGVGEMRTRLDVSRSRGFSKFVGRARELHALEDALEQTFAGDGQVVGLGAEAGTGKSRLCFEFMQQCRERGVTTYQTHCLPHGRSMPLSPVLELYRGIFGIDDDDAPRTARDKVAGRIVLLDQSLVETLPFLLDFLGIPDPERPVPATDPELRTRRMIDILQRLTRARGPRDPAVVLVEDLHWIDPASEAFLTSLVEVVPAGRLLLLVNMRPEYSAPWMQKSYYRHLPLAPLGTEAVDALLDDLLGDDATLAELRKRILERTEGNPFFIEEIVRELAERGHLAGTYGAYRLDASVEQVPVPDSVQGVLSARIDRLEDEPKAVLQAASAIGRTFALDLIAAVAAIADDRLTAHLARLVSDEFLYPEALYPQPEYAFKHALTRDVAYASLLSDRKRALHAALATELERRQADRGGERAALVAHHYEQAGQASRAAHWHERAATWIGLSDPRESYEHWRKVHELLARLDQTQETRLRTVRACWQAIVRGLRARVDDLDVAKLLDDARRAAASTGDVEAQTIVLTAEAGVRYFHGDFTRAGALMDEALEKARSIGSRQALYAGLPYWLIIRSFTKPARVLSLLEAIGEIDHAAFSDSVGFACHGWVGGWKALTASLVGRCAEARAEANLAVERARAGGERIDLAFTLSATAIAYDLLGEPEKAAAHSREAIRVAESTGVELVVTNAYTTMFISLSPRGWFRDEDEGASVVARLVEVANAFQQPGVCMGRAQLAYRRGRLDEALAAISDGVRQCDAVGISVVGALARIQRMKILLTANDAKVREDVGGALEEAREQIEEIGAAILVPELSIVRADLLGALGDDEGRRRELGSARDRYAEMGATECLARLDGPQREEVSGA